MAGTRVPTYRRVGAELSGTSFPVLGEGRTMKLKVPKVLIAQRKLISF